MSQMDDEASMRPDGFDFDAQGHPGEPASRTRMQLVSSPVECRDPSQVPAKSQPETKSLHLNKN